MEPRQGGSGGQEAKAKYLDCRAQLAERDEQLLKLRSRLSRKDAEIAEIKQVRICWLVWPV